MKFLTEQGYELIKNNLENELEVVEFILGLCNIPNNNTANIVGRHCGIYMDLERAYNCLMNNHVIEAKGVLLNKLYQMHNQGICEELTDSVVRNTVTLYNIRQWITWMETNMHSVYVCSIVLHLLYAGMEHIKHEEFRDQSTGYVYFTENMFMKETSFPEKNCDIHHVQAWIIDFLTDIKEQVK